MIFFVYYNLEKILSDVKGYKVDTFMKTFDFESPTSLPETHIYPR